MVDRVKLDIAITTMTPMSTEQFEFAYGEVTDANKAEAFGIMQKLLLWKQAFPQLRLWKIIRDDPGNPR